MSTVSAARSLAERVALGPYRAAMSQLVQMMVKAGVLTPDQAREARAQQVVYGDRIGTNLIDLGLVDETLLAQALGALHKVPYAAGPSADTHATLARALSKTLADRYSAVPARWDGQVMHVFMTDPHNALAIAEIEKALKRRVSPVVVPEARMWELLRKFYNIHRGLRALSLEGDPMARAQKLMKQAAAAAAARKPPEPLTLAPGLPVSAPVTPAAPAAELSSEDDFYAIYQQAGGSGMSATERALAMGEAAAHRKASASQARMPAVPPPPAPDDIPSVAMGTLLVDTPRAPPPAPPEPPTAAVIAAPPPPPPPPEKPSVFAAVGASAPAAWAPTLAQDVHVPNAPEPAIDVDVVEPPAPEAAPVTPLTFAQAREMLAGVEDRNAIARSVLRYALTPFRRAVLLTVQKDLAIGWDALGEGLDQAMAERIILPLQQASIFHLAWQSRAHFLGPVPRQPVNFLFLKLIGGRVPRSAFVLPVLVHGKVVNLLYGDNGGGQDANNDVGELLILAQHINRSYEALLKKAA